MAVVPGVVEQAVVATRSNNPANKVIINRRILGSVNNSLTWKRVFIMVELTLAITEPSASGIVLWKLSHIRTLGDSEENVKAEDRVLSSD